MSYYDQVNNELLNLRNQIDFSAKKLKFDTNEAVDLIQRNIGYLKKIKDEINILVKERQKGFPWLAKTISDLFSLQDNLYSYQLELKKHPAKKASDTVKEFNEKIRQLTYDNKKMSNLIEYYESIAPFLIELKEEVGLDKEVNYQPFDENELQDEVTKYLTIEEYRSLSTIQRNQMALDRYWSRQHSKLDIGHMYERYIGYLYEKKGYKVEYQGLNLGRGDLGRDLVCYKGREIVVIQCKNWSQFKTIFENSIFQFYGTLFQMRLRNPDREVIGHFYTTTSVSKVAQVFSQELGIMLYENFKLDKSYPCIRCIDSTSRKTKIYHLPFDQQYDNIKMSKNDLRFYCATVKEAEQKGYRRAYRYRPKR